jgi:hypothetical protein
VVKFYRFAPGLGIFFAPIYIKISPLHFGPEKEGGVVKFYRFPKFITILFAPGLV